MFYFFILLLSRFLFSLFFFFFNDTATTEIYTLSLHDALPILKGNPEMSADLPVPATLVLEDGTTFRGRDRKSTRLNSSHTVISYAVFCLKKKKKRIKNAITKQSVKTHKQISELYYIHSRPSRG